MGGGVHKGVVEQVPTVSTFAHTASLPEGCMVSHPLPEVMPCPELSVSPALSTEGDADTDVLDEVATHAATHSAASTPAHCVLCFIPPTSISMRGQTNQSPIRPV